MPIHLLFQDISSNPLEGPMNISVSARMQKVRRLEAAIRRDNLRTVCYKSLLWKKEMKVFIL